MGFSFFEKSFTLATKSVMFDSLEKEQKKVPLKYTKFVISVFDQIELDDFVSKDYAIF